jgi:hypothetical protein
MNNTKIALGILLVVGVASAFAVAHRIDEQPSEQIKIGNSVANPTTILSATEPQLDANGGGVTVAGVHYNGRVTIVKTEAKTGKRTLVADSKHNQITNLGYQFIVNKLTQTDTNATNKTAYISLAANGSTPVVAWTQISNELTTNGLARNGTATVTTNGTTGYNVSVTFTATGTTNNIALTGLHYENMPASDGNLFAALSFSNQSLNVNDELNIVWQITIS